MNRINTKKVVNSACPVKKKMESTIKKLSSRLFKDVKVTDEKKEEGLFKYVNEINQTCLNKIKSIKKEIGAFEYIL